jgi:uncharacterized protein YceH (UPF0502 family)
MASDYPYCETWARVDADAAELRVLGCLIEKQRTTPDVYPLSLNALRLACNQSTNRDPVVDYDEPIIRDALERLSRRGWARLASGPGSRAAKYRHLFDDALGLSDPEISLLAVLMLRGPQTLGELKQRTERLHRFGSLAEVQTTVDELASRELVARLSRRPGQKEDRYAQLLGEHRDGGAVSPPPSAGPDRVTELEERVSRLEAEVAGLRDALGAHAAERP